MGFASTPNDMMVGEVMANARGKFSEKGMKYSIVFPAVNGIKIVLWAGKDVGDKLKATSKIH
jgi:hypothetical protein